MSTQNTKLNIFASSSNFRLLPDENRVSGPVITKEMTPEDWAKYGNIKGNPNDKKKYKVWEHITRNKKEEDEMKVKKDINNQIDSEVEETIDLKPIAFAGKFYTYSLQIPGKVIISNMNTEREIKTDEVEQTIAEAKALVSELSKLKQFI